MMTNKTIKTLNLGLTYNDIKNDNFFLFVYSVITNKIGDEGAEAIGNSLNTNDTLEELQLGLNIIGSF